MTKIIKLISQSAGFSKQLISLMIVSLISITVSENDASAASAHVVSRMQPNSWLEIPNSRLAGVGADTAKHAGVQGVMGIDGVTAYSGGVFDTKRNRLVIWGGGHSDYHGNELYAFDVMSLQWQRLTEPSQPNLCEQVNSDGTPNSRHTYNGIAYIEHADRFFASGGALACNPGGCGADKTWTFNFDSNQWMDMKPRKTPETNCENMAAYDPVSKKVWWFDVPGLWSYHYEKNKWTQHNDDYLSGRTAAVDTKRGLLMVVGQEEVLVYNIRDRKYYQRLWHTTGAESLLEHWSPGLDYDPVLDRMVAWAGGSVFSLDMDSRVWVEHIAEGGPNTESLNDVYGLWRYVPSLKVFVVMTGAQNNIYFYKPAEN